VSAQRDLRAHLREGMLAPRAIDRGHAGQPYRLGILEEGSTENAAGATRLLCDLADCPLVGAPGVPPASPTLRRIPCLVRAVRGFRTPVRVHQAVVIVLHGRVGRVHLVVPEHCPDIRIVRLHHLKALR
jgi:hypothetical protein